MSKNGKNNSRSKIYSFAVAAIAMAICAGTAFAQTEDTFVSIPANGANEAIEYTIIEPTVETEPAVEEETTETTTTAATTTSTTVTTTVTTTAVTTTTPETTTTEATTTEAPVLESEVVEEFAVEAAAPAENTTYMTSIISMGEEEMWLYQHILAAECYSWWDYEGHKMIADVISNRVRSGLFPPSMAEVLTAPGQFETYSNGRYLECEPNDLQVMACYESMNGVNMIVPEDVLFFCTQEYYDTLPEDAWFKTLKIWNVYDNTIFFYAN